MEIDRPSVFDAEVICRVVRASIKELCFEDHKGDEDILSRWLANKTPDNVAQWLTNPTNINLVVRENGIILSAGCVTTAGEITLNYVYPAARFRGVSSLLLSGLEAAARSAGNSECNLESTATARRFYRGRSYLDTGDPRQKHGLTTYPMRKAL
jgi:GNAT superfamily N-acetyltransferase